MKKQFCIPLLLCLTCLLGTSCSKNAGLKSGSNTDGNKEAQDAIVTNYTIDVDLTLLSSTMIYAEVYNIMTNPDDYMGKTIKMNGPYYASYYDETGQYYHYVIIEDAAACCVQGLEFLWNGEHIYPDDYPEERTKIEVIGVFSNYEELGQTYYYLAVEKIEIL